MTKYDRVTTKQTLKIDKISLTPRADITRNPAVYQWPHKKEIAYYLLSWMLLPL